MDNDEAYKLFCNGNGVGDKSQFNFAPKSFFKWCDTVFGNTTESQRNKEKILSNLQLCKLVMNQSNLISVQQNERMAMFHEVSKEIDLKINEILANIAGNKQQLMEGQTIMQSQTECGVVIKQTYMHPKKAKAVKRLDKFNKKIQKLQLSKHEISKKITETQRPMNLVVSSINSIETHLDSAMETLLSRIDKNVSSVRLIDDNEDLEILNKTDDFQESMDE